MDEVLIAIARKLGDIRSLDDLPPSVLETLTTKFGADRAMFAVCDAHGSIRRAVRHNMPLGENGRLPVSETLIHEVLAEHRTVVVDDVENSAAYNDRDSVKLHNIRFMMGVPILGGSGLAGLLYIDSTHGKYRGPPIDKVEFLEGVASLVSLALRNLSTIEEMAYRGRFAASVFHNVRGSLHIMRTLIHEVVTPDAGSDAADALLGSIDALATLSGSVLELYKLEDSPRSHLVWVDLGVEVRQRTRLIGLFARTVTQKGLSIEVSDAPLILTDASRLGVVIDELLLNAVKYSAIGHAVTIEVRVADRGDAPAPPQASPSMHRLPQLQAAPGTSFTRIRITNANRDGPISPEAQEQMFEPFVRIAADNEPKWHPPSSGLGLSIVRELVKSLGGEVAVESDEKTTSLILDLPSEVLTDA